MAGVGRISMLVSKDLQVLIQAAMQLDPEVRKQLRAQTRRVVEPAFFEEMRSRGETRLQQRVLVSTARVAVSDSNITLKSGTVGRVGRGLPASSLASATEFGAQPDRKVEQRSRKGRAYTRRLGRAFLLPKRAGNVFFPSVKAFIPRAAALWIQTAKRTTAETFEKVM